MTTTFITSIDSVGLPVTYEIVSSVEYRVSVTFNPLLDTTVVHTLSTVSTSNPPSTTPSTTSKPVIPSTTTSAASTTTTTSATTSPSSFSSVATTGISTTSPTSSASGQGGSVTPGPTSAGGTKKNTGVGAGAVAGAAIACLIGGALIAGLLTWFFMKRSNQKKRHSGGGFASERNRSSRGPPNEKALPVAPVAVGGVAGNWEKHLDQPESDATITRSVKGVFDHIEVHVENFYRDAQVPITPELQASLMNVDSHHLPDSVAGLLPQSQRPTLLIKHCITQAIVEHISPESEIPDSFLPTDYSALPSTLSATRTNGNKPAFHQAFSRWRVLSAYLRPTPSNDTTYKSQRDAHINALADQLSRTFEPWAMSRDSFTTRRDNLINIMRSAADSGILLFSQPSTFRWRWAIPASKSGRLRIVLLPGLDKVRDENAAELERPLEMLKPVTGVVIG